LRISSDALALLQRYSWPGNVRELAGVIQLSQILCDSDVIHPNALPSQIRKGDSSASLHLQELREQLELPPEGIDLQEFLGSIERKFIQQALERCDGNQVHAAALLGISRDQLRYRLFG